MYGIEFWDARAKQWVLQRERFPSSAAAANWLNARNFANARVTKLPEEKAVEPKAGQA